MKKLNALWLLALSPSTFASSVDLGGSSSGFLSSLADFFQDLVDFVGTTGSMLIIFLSITVGLALWVFAAKQSGAALGFLFRACVAGICFFGMGTFIAWLQSYAG